MSSGCRYLGPGDQAARRALRRRGHAIFSLTRRGIRHGFVAVDGQAVAAPPDESERWQRARPIVLRGILTPGLAAHRRACAATLRAFARWRAGAPFQAWVLRRLHRDRSLTPAGTTIDLGDEREIEKVWADGVSGGRVVARDLYAKLTWIAHDAFDASLRIRFSAGAERLQEWHRSPRLMPWANRLARALFPECDVLAGRRALVTRIARHCGRRVRLAERIVYNNVPGGGAVFHHDAEPTQLGVCFGQLAGETAWLALPRAELAAAVAVAWRCTVRRAQRALDDPDVPRLRRLLDHSPRFTARLAELGALQVVHAGDVILLPTIAGRETCWHSVFGIGARPSLAHSYGIFAATASPSSTAD